MKRIFMKITALALTLALFFSFTGIFASAREKLPFANSQFFEQGDYRIHYRVFEAEGEMKGRILFLHGFLVSTYSWERMTAEMTQAGYECVLADLPGFGYSSRENGGTRVIPREDLMVALMESIAPLDSWILAGHSMGGGVSLNIAVAHPELRALLLYCPAPITQFPLMLKPMVTSWPMAKLYTLIFKITALAPKFIARLVVGYIAQDMPFGLQYETTAVTDPLQLEGTGEGIAYMSANAAATDMDALAGLEMPVLLIQGGKDNVLQAQLIADTNAALPQAELFVIEDGGHMLNENKAAEASAITVDFLDRRL